MKKTVELEKYFSENEQVGHKDYLTKNYDITYIINKKLKAKKLKVSDMSSDLNLDRTNIYKYLNKQKRFKRDVLLLILIYLDFSAEEVQRILKFNEYQELYVKKKRDQIIYHGIAHDKSIDEINQLLSRHDEKTL